MLPSQAPESAIQEDLLELFWQSKNSLYSNNDSNRFAERHLKFCLTRLNPNPEIVFAIIPYLFAIIPYLVERPWLTDFIYRYLRKCKLEKEAVEKLKDIIATHSVYDSTVASAIETLIQQKVSLRSLHGLFRKWLNDNKRDWPLLCAAVMALGENPDNVSVIVKVISSPSYSPSVRRTAIIQALGIARDKHEAVCILKIGIHDNAPTVIDSLLYQLYVEQGLTIQKLGLDDSQNLAEYCIASARGYDNSLPHLQASYIRYVFIRFYKVKFTELVDFHILLGSEYNRAENFLWQADKSYLSNPSRYVSQLDLFHEELLYPILVDKLKLKTSRKKLQKCHYRVGCSISKVKNSGSAYSLVDYLSVMT
jgi:hypothetical protein